MKMYARGQAPLLPYKELDPEEVARAIKLAIAMLDPGGLHKFIKASGYKERTIKFALETPADKGTISDRVRTDLKLCAMEILMEHKQTFFDLAFVQTTEIPEGVYPYRIVGPYVEVPIEWQSRLSNPIRYNSSGSVRWTLWQVLYLSCKPAHSPYIHLYGKPAQVLKYMVATDGVEFDMSVSDIEWIKQLMGGPTGYLNTNSTIANPAILDKLARDFGLKWNVWGHALMQDVEDIAPHPVEGVQHDPVSGQ